ncbi:DUF4190 domain-containing protein [Homoserinibacter sp. GY 40078]|uniref:DUF4190 domain-containing protein n=1 Tax=Homoserinibacter sp. GY 40078 TaxID=2603275 RepID=UPI0011C8A517|nr:DUF4190 domain-containing protein [Homoserinibacter sp. GY 40078]TXK17155.1 DUF4190 domain-containing protein [Homoserinibacter sp. GY 40078]
MTDNTTAPAADGATSTADAELPDTPTNPYAAPAKPAAPTTGPGGLSIASLVLGIASIPTGIAVAGVVGIVLGFLARSREPQSRTMSTWGIVLGFVSVFGWVLIAILGILFAAPFAFWGMHVGWDGFGPGFFHGF